LQCSCAFVSTIGICDQSQYLTDLALKVISSILVKTTFPAEYPLPAIKVKTTKGIRTIEVVPLEYRIADNKKSPLR
jgi:hypothetical protein